MALQFAIVLCVITAIAAGVAVFERNARKLFGHKFLNLQAFLMVAMCDGALGVMHQVGAVFPGGVVLVRLIAGLCIVAMVVALGYINVKATNQAVGAIGTVVQLAVFLPATTAALLASVMALSLAPVVLLFYIVYRVFRPRRRAARRRGPDTIIPA